ncbi:MULTISPECIES: HD domain-containing protein [Cytobacillus]|uniref:HD domain-containing protein n=1 Tax=Cytobacillus TaxID=2675230 RepID=UPI001864F21E|nr:HD domain-containing protein [Cytobacillus oceanisediminis]MCS0827066.1 HD domain-containing protein [Cytobacillus firmus]MBU8731539.1 HD domain-containing protein [Cytobacillus oceanisediminis]MCM3243493.1 HD domain-containing protein [Cytobacillus oceanisediminis]MCM3394992.1 HD domain-containing protein [Cytobacillus oceanisediminis]QOK29731.1 HD domain-containing protein [Cytobacillus oceanisediminis]
MMKEKNIHLTEKFVRDTLGEDSTGHDWHHIERVRKNALYIAKKEQAGDPFLIEMAALLHDIPDAKLNTSREAGERKLSDFLQEIEIAEEASSSIKTIIDSVSFKGGNNKKVLSVEAKIVQDADRLDAIGAVGIARAFAYGGKKGQPIHDPGLEIRKVMTEDEYRNGKSSSINHFYEKLLKLRDLLNTDTAREMAEERHQIMEKYLHQFFIEWNGQA